MNAEVYRRLLRDQKSNASELNQTTSHHSADNNLKHTTKATKELLGAERWNTLDWLESDKQSQYD